MGDGMGVEVRHLHPLGFWKKNKNLKIKEYTSNINTKKLNIVNKS
jgi:hypothetical protein